MKITVISGIAVFTSAVLMSDLETLKKVTPEVLIAKNEEKEIEFVVDTGSKGSVGTYGITFDKTDASGFASTSVEIGNIPADKVKEFIATKYGKAIAKMNSFEEVAPERIALAKSALETAMNNITIM
jgi:hypothetical protein